MSEIKLNPTWLDHLKDELATVRMKQLLEFLKQEIDLEKSIYPNRENIFSAFNETPFEQTKVVLFGQDPYHGEGQAHGLCFSVNRDVRIPPSLRNVYKELHADLEIAPPSHGHLINWARQGVLMLNSVLTVEKSKPKSHQKKGWEEFTDGVVKMLNEKKSNLVFLLWGRDAQKKGANIDRKRHLVLEAAHPSPLAGNRFLGCRHFSQTNSYLEKNGMEPINWKIV